MIYLVLSALCLALLYGVYRLALSRTTMHRFNRFLLLCIFALSAFLPAVRIDRVHLGFNKAEQKVNDEIPYIKETPVRGYIPALRTEYLSDYDDTEYVSAAGETAVMTPPAVKADTRTRIGLALRIIEVLTQMNIITVITYIYLFGVSFFIIRLFVGIIRAETLCRLGGRNLSDGSRLVVCDGDFQPTSWRKTIIMSRKDYESDNAGMIVEHEQAHIRFRHSIDVVLAQTACALQWFNPAAWALKRSLQEIHEYEADASVLADGENERQYQICLVQAALGGRIGYVTSNFADCSTKKRITMMKRSQSSPFVCLRALLMLPVVLFTILLASACKPKASQDNTEIDESESMGVNLTLLPPASQLEPADTTFLKKFGLGANQDLKIKQLNRFVEVEWDGAIWITLDGEQTFHPATLENFTQEFERLKGESTIEVARPDLVFVTNANEEHLDIVQNIIKQLQKSYSDDKIVLITMPGIKTVPPPPAGYAVDYDVDKCVEVEVNRRNGIQVTAYNVTRILTSAQELRPTIESFATSAGTDSVAIEVRADNTILVKVPKVSYTVDSPEKLKALLLRLYPEESEKVLYKVEYRFATSRRLVDEVEHVFSDNPSKYENLRAKPFVRTLPSMPTRKDSIKYILLGDYGSGMDRSRHVKSFRWYIENRDKEEFFRMGFRDGKIYVCKGNDVSKMEPVEFDQLVPYFKKNCPGGDERKAIVLFEIATDDESVSVAFMDKVLEKMENWITTLTRRIWVTDVPVPQINVVEIINVD